MSSLWFDDVAKSLARGHFRRAILRALGAAGAAALLGALAPASARASSACVEFCMRTGRRGRELGECIADCERGARCGNDRCDPETEYCATCATIEGPREFCLPIGAVC